MTRRLVSLLAQGASAAMAAPPATQALPEDWYHRAAGELAGGSINPQHLKLLSDWSDLYRHLITLAFAQHGPAQRGFAADDLNELSAADQLHAAPIRAEKELSLLVVGIDQADQRAELYAFAGIVGARAELAPIGQRVADGVGTTSLAGGQVGSF
jgi:hypothetical protein